MIVEKVYAAAVKTTPIFAFDAIKDIGDLFTWVTNLVIIIGFGLVIVFLALGFIKFITSQGDKEATAQAQKWVSYSALGGVGLLAVYTIRAIILNLTGAESAFD